MVHHARLQIINFWKISEIEIFFRAERIESETFVCQTSSQIICPNENRVITNTHNVNLNDNSTNDILTTDNSTTESRNSNGRPTLIQDILDDDDNSANDNSTHVNSTYDKMPNVNITGEVCHPNVVAICQTKPEIVTVTEQRQVSFSSTFHSSILHP
jgi:hypothetical protein